MDGRLVVLGGCGAWPEPGRACSGFLLEHDGFRVALDLGYGTLPRLLSLLGSTTAVGLDAVVVTHDHPDHVVDLHGLLRARLYELERERQRAELESARRSQIGSGERAEKIRTYNFPENRVTDHRVKVTLHRLDSVLNGELDELTEALSAEERRRALDAAAV